MHRSGITELGRHLRVVGTALLLAACWPYGFAGGGLPEHIRTVAVLPLENETAVAELQRELTEAVRIGIERRLGLRAAAEERAHAVVRGVIRQYDLDVPIAYSADPNQTSSARRQLQLTVDIEIIDQTSGKVLWQRKGLVANGEYNERDERSGRQRAIEKVVNDVIEGAQSQW